MTQLTKGAATRLQIVEKARKIYNDHGIDITISTLAQQMGVTRSRISNHFPTKESLFIAILQEYEEEYAAIQKQYSSVEKSASLQLYVDYMGDTMDAQYKYRCGIIFLNVLSPSQHELKKQIRENYGRNLLLIRSRIQNLVDQGLVEPRVFREPAWSSFLFVLINLMTQWVVHLDMYDRNKSYAENKALYLRGIFTHVYLPYLTEKGKQALVHLKFASN